MFDLYRPGGSVLRRRRGGGLGPAGVHAPHCRM